MIFKIMKRLKARKAKVIIAIVVIIGVFGYDLSADEVDIFSWVWDQAIALFEVPNS